MSAEWIDHKGKRILYIRYSGLSVPDQLALIESATQLIVNTQSMENLTLSDVTNMVATQAFLDLAKVKGKISGPYTKKAAVVGVDGVRKILLKAVNVVSGNPRVPFNTIEEAKDWLVK